MPTIFGLVWIEPTNLMVITGFMEFEKPLDFNRLYATIESRLASFPALSKKNCSAKIRPSGTVGKEDPHFDLRSHLQRIAFRHRAIKPNCRNDRQFVGCPPGS
jgi:hypothetical protein